jgi:SAM-dependent methyltransferase
MRSMLLQSLKAVAMSRLRRGSVLHGLLATLYNLPRRAREVGFGHAVADALRPAKMRLTRDGRFTARELGAASGTQPNVLKVLLHEFRPKSMLDVGCGVGAMLAIARAQELDIWGLEGSAAAIKASRVADCIQLANLNEPQDLGRKFDLVWSVEVAEHIHPKYTDIFLDTIARHGALVLMSAARPGQGGIGHFNEQAPAYWVARMAARGFVLDAPISQKVQATGDAYADNMMVFRQAPDRHKSAKQT